MAKSADDRWREVDAIFAAALEHNPAERDAFLARACHDDEDLWRSVHGLLRSSLLAESFLERPIFTFADGMRVTRTGSADAGANLGEPPVGNAEVERTDADGPVPDPLGLTGRQLSHFRVREVLACGGMGVVYRAEDLRLGRIVALKFLLPQYSLDVAAKRRFLGEARAAAMLDHPNLCTVHEAGETEEGHLFLAMVCYAGETLRSRLARAGPLPVEESVGLARQIARGLSAAHGAGITHRDLKPGNLMLTPEGTVKILDFGLSKVRDLSNSRLGERAGTVAYMSPEHLAGGAVDGRSDLWSLGVVLYEMLGGSAPFGAGHELSTVHRILKEEPVPLRELRPEIPARLEDIVRRLLCKDPDRRVQTAAELAHAFPPTPQSSILAPNDQEAIPPPGRGSGSIGRIRRAGVLAAAAILAWVGVSLAVGADPLDPIGWIQARMAWDPANRAESAPVHPVPDRIANPKSVAVLPLVNRGASDHLTDGIADEIVTTLANVGDLRVISRTSVLQYRETSKPIRQIAAELGVAHILEGSVQQMGDRLRIAVQLIDATTEAHLWAEQYERPLVEIFTVQSEIAQQVARALDAQITAAERARLDRQPTSSLAAYQQVLRGREAIWTDRRSAFELLRGARELDPRYPEAHTALALLFRAQYQDTGERGWLDSAVVAARRAIALDPEFAEGHERLGWALDRRGDLDDALLAHQRAVELNPNLSGGLANLYHFGFGRLDEAARWWNRAIEGDPTNALYHQVAGWTHMQLGSPARARPLFERSIQVRPDGWPSQYWLGMLLVLEGREAEARAHIERMVAAANQSGSALLSAGEITVYLGDLPAARLFYERGLEATASDWQEAHATLMLAWILSEAGEPDRALLLALDANRKFAKRWGGAPNRPEDFEDLAKIRLMLGDRDGALEQFERGVRRGWHSYYDRPLHPILRSLSGDPRFERLRAEMKASADRQRTRVEHEGW